MSSFLGLSLGHAAVVAKESGHSRLTLGLCSNSAHSSSGPSAPHGIQQVLKGQHGSEILKKQRLLKRKPVETYIKDFAPFSTCI